MKHWNETAAVLLRVAELTSAGRRAAIATVVRITGSAYRRPGAKFLVEDDGRTLGGVSGGCLEADVHEVALDVMRTAVPRLLHYDTGADDRTVWGLGLGCYGSVDIFVQSTAASSATDTLEPIRALLNEDAPFAVCTIVDGPADVGRSAVVTSRAVHAVSAGQPDLDRELARVASACLAAGASKLDEIGPRLMFADVLTPPPPLIVCGAGDDARPLIAYASEAGFRVTVVDHRPALVTADRFPSAWRLVALTPEDGISTLGAGSRTSVVIQTHSLAHDGEWLRQFIQTDAPYIGLLGPRARKDEIVAQIGAVARDRVFGPIGLDLGAEGPEQIAISILSELLAVHARREPGHLRDRGAAIHAF